MKKILCVLSIIFLLSLIFVPLVSAAYVCPAQGADTSNTYTVQLRHAMPSVYYPSGVGMAFTSNSTCFLYNWTVPIFAGAGEYTFVARLYEVQGGVVGNNAYPTSTVLAESTTYDSSVLSGTETDFTFEFDGSYEMFVSTDYVITIEIDTYTSGTLQLYQGTGSVSQNGVIHQSGIWTTYSGRDFEFVINGDSVDSGATPTPTPPSSGSGGGDADMEALTDAILPFLVPLLICLIPALLGYKFVGELGFFIGLNVGCILAYVTLAGTAYAFPLWGIILVGVMDVAVVLMRR